MKKIKRNFEVDFYFDWTYGVTLEKIKKDMESLERLGVTSIDIESDDYFGSTSVSIKAIRNRIETDEECKERTAREQAARKIAEQREMDQFNRLKAKFEKK